jgi:hypothetical protein
MGSAPAELATKNAQSDSRMQNAGRRRQEIADAMKGKRRHAWMAGIWRNR